MNGGHLADNIAEFGRLLRRAGMPVGTARIVEAVRAAEIVGVASRQDFRAALASVFVARREEIVVFDAAFERFWCSGHLATHFVARKPPLAKTGPDASPPAPAAARITSAFWGRRDETPADVPRLREVRLAVSASEALRRRDFAQMGADELAAAGRAIAALTLPDDKAPTRRHVASRSGGIDPRRTLRLAMRTGGEMIRPARRTKSVRPPPIVALLDISGSMSAYSRVVLHFLHALGRQRRVATFLFGTRLSNVTRVLNQRDIDEALAACSAAVPDWSGGTRIGAALRDFNRLWSRRVLGQGAIVLLVTDGLDRDGGDELGAEADRLHRSCRRLVWLNPLLRYDGFEARARGVRALLPHVDEFRSIHSLAAVEDLVRSLSAARSGSADPRRWLATA